MFILLIIN